jgi:membrane protease YdiL (CAAX protease family)
VPFLAVYHLVLFGLYFPAQAVRVWLRHRKRPAAPVTLLPSRTRILRNIAAAIAYRGTISLVVAMALGLAVFPAAWPSPSATVLGACAYTVMIATGLPHWRRLVVARRPVAQRHMPISRAESAWWCVVSFAAGAFEELTWRGVQVMLLGSLIGAWPAAIVCAATFGVGHLSQGSRWAAVVALHALMFQGLVWASGSLYIAMAVHAAVDLTGGFYSARLAKQTGYGLPDRDGLPTPPMLRPSGLEA